MNTKYTILVLIAITAIIFLASREIEYIMYIAGKDDYDLSVNPLYYALRFHAIFFSIALLGVFYLGKNKLPAYEPLSIIAIFSISINYFVIEYISRIGVNGIGLPILSRGDSELLIFCGAFVTMLLGQVARSTIRKNGKRGLAIANISARIGGLIVFGWVLFIFLYMWGMSGW